MLTSHSGWMRLNSLAICSDCHMASRLWRDAITMRSGARCNFLSSSGQGFYLGPLPAAHGQLLASALEYHRPPGFALGFGAALEPADPAPGDQAIAMDAQEHAAKLMLDLSERFLD